jgi:hypothetical protein
MSTHQLERAGARDYRCSACGWAWTRPPASHCPGVPRYGRWDAVPPQLKTQTQLKAAGLQPGGSSRGCVAGPRTWAGETWYWHYDECGAVPRRRATSAQRAYAGPRRTCPTRRSWAAWPLDGDLCPSCEAEEWEVALMDRNAAMVLKRLVGDEARDMLVAAFGVRVLRRV